MARGSAETCSQRALQTTDLHPKAIKEGSVTAEEHGTGFNSPGLSSMHRDHLCCWRTNPRMDSHQDHVSFHRTLQSQMLSDQVEGENGSLNGVVEAAAAGMGTNTAAGTINGFSANLGLPSSFF